MVRKPSRGTLANNIEGKKRLLIAIGDKVRVVFREKAKRTGSILDIEQFKEVASSLRYCGYFQRSF